MQTDINGAACTQPRTARMIFWFVLASVFLVVGIWIYSATGPRYHGHTATYWFAAYESRDADDREAAATAFRSMGSNAVPMLIRALESPPPRYPRYVSWLYDLWNRFRRVPVDRNQQYNWRRERACHLLREIGEPASEAIPALEKASSNGLWYIATSSRAALIKIRHEPLTQYFELLKDRSDAIKWYPTAMLLGYCGTNATPAIPLLIESLSDSNNIIQAHAIIALGLIRSEPQVCVPKIIPFLTNSDVALRQKAYFAVLAFKDHAQGASNEIILGLNDSDPWIQSQAVLAVAEILSPADQRRALPQVEALAKSPDPFVSDFTKKLLPRIRASASR